MNESSSTKVGIWTQSIRLHTLECSWFDPQSSILCSCGFYMGNVNDHVVVLSPRITLGSFTQVWMVLLGPKVWVACLQSRENFSSFFQEK